MAPLCFGFISRTDRSLSGPRAASFFTMAEKNEETTKENEETEKENEETKKEKEETKAENEKFEGVVKKSSTLKSALSQVLACAANNFILFDNGLVLSTPSMLIADLVDHPEELTLSSDQLTWLAVVIYVCVPIGSVFSGLFMEPLGRKRSMMLLNIPFFVGWIILYMASSPAHFLFSAAIMGFGVGCSEAPIVTYVGEVTEPRYRGVLCTYAQLWGQLAYVFLFTCTSLTTWRKTIMCCVVVPIITFVAVSQIPESPMWLISKGRLEEAELSLRRLRGWVSPAAVAQELDQLILYYQESEVQGTEPAVLGHRKSFLDKLQDFFHPRMRTPVFLITVYFFVYYASGLQTIRPHLIHLFTLFKMPIHPHKALAFVCVSGAAGNLVCMILVRFIGKRLLTLISLWFCGVCGFFLSAASIGYLSVHWPFRLFLMLSFFTGLGVAPIPWVLQSELYPFRGKCLAAGIVSAGSYVIGCMATKSYSSLMCYIGQSGMFIMFGIFSTLGALFLYWKLPETEGKSFTQIEEHFQKHVKDKPDPPPRYEYTTHM